MNRNPDHYTKLYVNVKHMSVRDQRRIHYYPNRSSPTYRGHESSGYKAYRRTENEQTRRNPSRRHYQAEYSSRQRYDGYDRKMDFNSRREYSRRDDRRPRDSYSERRQTYVRQENSTDYRRPYRRNGNDDRPYRQAKHYDDYQSLSRGDSRPNRGQGRYPQANARRSPDRQQQWPQRAHNDRRPRNYPRKYDSSRRSRSRQRGRQPYRRPGYYNHHHHNQQHSPPPREQPKYSPSPSGGKSSFHSGSASNDDDAGHYQYQIGGMLGKNYKILGHLGDGTFGRTLKCQNLDDRRNYAVKVIRPVRRYNDSAKIEQNILEDVRKNGGENHHLVLLHEAFWIEADPNRVVRNGSNDTRHCCLVFETLGKSLYEFIKANKYFGFHLSVIQKIAKQVLEGIRFMHEELKLTHTDLKPENILLKKNYKTDSYDQSEWPIQVRRKKALYGGEKVDDSEDSDGPQFSDQPTDGCTGGIKDGQSAKPRVSLDQVGRDTVISTRDQLKRREKRFKKVWAKPLDDEVKIIDFGGATYESEQHNSIINTRQYRAPEVILQCQKWNEKSDIWSMACIIIEMYTGELFYETRDDIEHLAMIEKECGPLPSFMIHDSSHETNRLFGHLHEFHGFKMNLDMRKHCSASSIAQWKKMRLASDLIQFKFNEFHEEFLSLVEFMMKADPSKRPSARSCLEHNFFKLEIPASDK